VRPVTVVVVFELVQHGCGVSLVDDQEAVEEFAADRPDEALGDRIRPRCPHRRLDDPDVDGGEDGVEGGGEPAVAVSNLLMDLDDANRGFRFLIRDAARRGYGCAMGSPLLLVTEYKNPRTTGRLLARRAHPGAIIVVHEGTESRVAVSAVAHSLLAGLTERHLRAVTLSELTAKRRNRDHSCR
jgi:hypothetical protein